MDRLDDMQASLHVKCRIDPARSSAVIKSLKHGSSGLTCKPADMWIIRAEALPKNQIRILYRYRRFKPALTRVIWPMAT